MQNTYAFDENVTPCIVPSFPKRLFCSIEHVKILRVVGGRTLLHIINNTPVIAFFPNAHELHTLL